MTSECPPRYFVVEWTTMSAPSSSGCCRYGVAKVLSTTTSAPTACAASAAAAMSITFRSGFVGDLQPDDARALVEVLGETGPDLLGRKVGEAIALRLVDLREHAVDAAVDVVHAHDVLARVDQVHDRRGRAKAGREGEPVIGVLQRREAGLERRPRRVARARVVVALVLPHRVLNVGRRLVDGRRHGARSRVRVLPSWIARVSKSMS